MTNLLNLLGRKVGKLTVKRDLFGDGNAFHCECKCGGSRKVSRGAVLSKTVNGCAACAAKSKHSGKRETPMPIEAEPVARIILPDCLGCVSEHGWLRIQVDCQMHSPLYRTAPLLARGPEMVGSKGIVYRRRAVGDE